MNATTTEHDEIVQTMQHYIDGGRAGESGLMRPAFHPDATIVGYCGEALLTGPIQQLFGWIDANGPAPGLDPRFVSIDILETVAVCRLEVEHWSGKLAGADVHMSDAFTLLKTKDGWKISQKTFHWHVQ